MFFTDKSTDFQFVFVIFKKYYKGIDISFMLVFIQSRHNIQKKYLHIFI